MAPPQIMCSGQSYDLLVGEAHAVENMADVVRSLGAVWQATSRWKLGVINEICASWCPQNLRAAHCLHRHATRQRPHVRVGYPRVLLLDGLEEDAGMLQAGIGRVASLGFIAHAGAIRAACIGLEIVGTGGMPRRQELDPVLDECAGR